MFAGKHEADGLSSLGFNLYCTTATKNCYEDLFGERAKNIARKVPRKGVRRKMSTVDDALRAVHAAFTDDTPCGNLTSEEAKILDEAFAGMSEQMLRAMPEQRYWAEALRNVVNGANGHAARAAMQARALEHAERHLDELGYNAVKWRRVPKRNASK
jgi:hypothetical protein